MWNELKVLWEDLPAFRYLALFFVLGTIVLFFKIL